jgi:hypothetical protein
LSSRHRREKKRETLLAALGWLVCASTPNMGKELFRAAAARDMVKSNKAKAKPADHDIKVKCL